jgi:hypothetical protein
MRLNFRDRIEKLEVELRKCDGSHVVGVGEPVCARASCTKPRFVMDKLEPQPVVKNIPQIKVKVKTKRKDPWTIEI